MKITIAKFPGSLADDAARVIEQIPGVELKIVWHDQESLGGPDLLLIPGGFSFGDYLRPGALARSSGIAPAIRRFSREGMVLGIGNGFQILCELGVLPGVLLPNIEGEFCSEEVEIRLQNTHCALTKSIDEGTIFRLPLGCFSGRYVADQRTLVELEEKGCVVFRYCDEEGNILLDAPVTGSVRAVAGVTNFTGNVLGMMVRPEYAASELLGNIDGRTLFEKIFSSLGLPSEMQSFQE